MGVNPQRKYAVLPHWWYDKVDGPARFWELRLLPSKFADWEDTRSILE
jgi:hypothetical protein